jgi:hypothetical protein
MTPEDQKLWAAIYIKGSCDQAALCCRDGATTNVILRELDSAETRKQRPRRHRYIRPHLGKHLWLLRAGLISALTYDVPMPELRRYVVCWLAVADYLPDAKGAAVLGLPVEEFQRLSMDTVREVIGMEPIYARIMPWV